MDNQFPLPGPSAPLPGQIPAVPSNSNPPGPIPVTPLVSPEEATPPPPGYQPPASFRPPVIRPSLAKIILPILIGLIVLGGVGYIVSKLLAGNQPPKSATPSEPVSITYYGLWEPASVMSEVINKFQQSHPTIKVNYQLQSPQDYQDRMKTILTSNNTPDIVRLHSTWLPVFAQDIIPAPSNTISATEISTNFYPIFSNLLVAENQIYGVPLAIEGLALYINSAMLEQKSLTPPVTWEDVLTDAKLLTEVDPGTGKIVRSGIALGNTTNVDGWPDIVTLMLLQAGVNPLDPRGAATSEVLNFYTDFVTKHKVWDDTMPPSTAAFANERVAMMIAPSWRAPEIKAMNPTLAWQVVPVPQLPDSDPVTWASVWVETVPKNSKHPKEAWTFLSYLASAEAQQTLFEAAAKDRNFPQPPAHKAVATIAQNNPVIAPYVSGLNNAGTFYTASLTRDSKTGLNSRLIKYLEDAINTVGSTQDKSKVTDTLAQGFAQVLSEYGLVSAPATAPTP